MLRRSGMLAASASFLCLILQMHGWSEAAGPAPERSSGAGPRPAWSHLNYALYFCHHDIETLLVDPKVRQETLAYFAAVRPRHAYLEAPGDRDVDVPQMRRVADALRAEGLKVSGALVPVRPGGPLCYNDPDDMALLEKRARAMAQVFDEIITDDWLFTTCTCAKCVAGRGQASWAEYRPKLIQEKVARHLLAAAKQVNPEVRVIVKYPNWYESHLANGYDVHGETQLFDAMAVGIETRTRATHDQHIPTYSGYVFQKWWGGVDRSKWIGSWLDNYAMKGQDHDYVAQVWQAVLARTPEIILWSAGHLHPTGPFSDVFPHLRDTLPELDRVAGLLTGEGRGVPMYLPYGSTGEYNLFGHLGMAGIPIEPTGEFPVESQVAIFSLHSLRDPQLAAKMLARIRSGRDVFMTHGLYRKLGDTEFRHMMSVISDDGRVTSSSFRSPLGWRTETIEAKRPFTFPAVATATWPDVRRVAVVREDYDYGVFFDSAYLGAHLYVLNLPDNAYDLVRLPQQALDPVREAFARELGVSLSGPGGVAFYPFGERQYVLYNMSDSAATMALVFDKKQGAPANAWKELVHGKLLGFEDVAAEPWHRTPVRTRVSVSIQPFELVILQAP